MKVCLSFLLLITMVYFGGCQENTRIKKDTLEKAIFGAGCFWGVEYTFSEMDGVLETKVGYMGGSLNNPTYKDVCTDRSGHAEVVQVIFDPAIISYEKLLNVFWEMHDPTTFNRQGPDFGSQYRSVIFFVSETQKKLAEASRMKLNKSGTLASPVVTEISEAGDFWKAEEYHQDYYKKNGIKGCRVK